MLRIARTEIAYTKTCQHIRGGIILSFDETLEHLNKILGIENMVIEKYDTYITYFRDPEIRVSLREFQADHKKHALLLSSKIQSLGGIPHEKYDQEDYNDFTRTE
jgi:bacterioferritin (cytochrome b1)